MLTHVELDRAFLPLGDEKDFDPDELRVRAWFGLSGQSWNDLLKKPRVVILAEAGTGKTHELRAKAEALKAMGRAAFFCRIEDLASDGLPAALDPVDDDSYRAWQEGGDHGWYFLDAVNETHLVSPNSFEKALRRLCRALGAAADRASIYITARVSDWRANADLETLNRILPPPEERKEPDDQDEFGAPVSSGQGQSGSQREKQRSAILVQLAPLKLQAMRVFAVAQGVEDADAFMAAIERADAEVFAERPQDLLDLIAYWRRDGRLGSHEEMVAFNVQAKLQEPNPNRDEIRPLAPERALRGAEVMAAASILGMKGALLLPDHPTDPDRAAQALDPGSALPDWDARDLQTLLGRAIFDEATYGRVRFHHRSVPEYLTARWLAHLLNEGARRRSVERLMFARVYGLDVVIPSMRPVAAWLALWDEHVRDLLLATAPEVLIESGDPSRLPLPVREGLLRRFAELHAQRKDTGVSFDLAAVRRLADPGLAHVVGELLNQYRDDEDVRELLLRIIWQGKISACAEAAVSFALDPDKGSITRVCAVRAVVAAGDTGMKRRLADAITDEFDSWDARTLSSACAELFPSALTIAELQAILERVEPPGRWAVSGFPMALEEIAREKCPKERCHELLKMLVELLKCEPHVERRHAEISSRNSWLLPAAGILAERILKDEDEEALDEAVLSAVELVGVGRAYDLHQHTHPERLEKLIGARRDVNRALFWRSVDHRRQELGADGERLTDWWRARHVGTVWTLAERDFDFFLTDLQIRRLLDDRLVALTAAFNIWQRSGRSRSSRQALNRAVHGHPELKAKLQEMLHPPPPSDEDIRYQKWFRNHERRRRKRERRDAEARQAFAERLRQDPTHLRKIGEGRLDEVFPDLYDFTRLIQKLSNSDTRWGASDWALLEPEFGREVAEAARDGLMAFWRVFRPPIRSDRQEGEPIKIPLGVVVGLTGLAIESRERPDWSSRLSREEALLATCYATLEMNGFPNWVLDLHEAHPEAVSEVVGQELKWEFELDDSAPPPHHVLSSLAWGPEALRNRFVGRVFELLRVTEPSQVTTLENSLIILSSSPQADGTALASLASERFAETLEQGRRLTWLVTWFCEEAGGAIDAFSGWLAEAPLSDDADQRMISFCSALIDHRTVRFKSIRRDFERVEILRELLPLVYSHVRIEDDAVHEGIFTPGARDNAESTRGYLLQQLCDTPGRPTYDALLEFSHCLPHPNSRQRMAALARRRAAADGEFDEPWEPQDVAEFSKNAERLPRSSQELFEVVLDRLDDLKADLEEGDASEAQLLRRAQIETEVRTWFTSRLRASARGRYSVPPEEELADGTRPDLRIHNSNVDAPVAIELKMADNWSYRQLSDALSNQLVGQYLRDCRSCYGVFLLTWHGRKKRWRHPASGRMLVFDRMVASLLEETDTIVAQDRKVDGLALVGVDLTQRTASASQRSLVGAAALTPV